jgi:hypothetical protein
MTKIKSFLQPRFKQISSLKDTILEQNDENSIFEAELKQLAESNDIIAAASKQDEIEKGLLQLKNKGWLTDKDYGAIMASAKNILHA